MENNSLLISEVDHDFFFCVDLDTDTRAIFSNDTNPDNNNPLLAPGEIVIDTSGNRALVPDRFQDAILSVDLTTGARTILIDNISPDFIAIDSGTGLLFGVEDLTTLASYDLQDGARQIIYEYDSLSLNDIPASYMFGISKAANSDIIYMIDQQLDAIMAMDVLTGDRVILLR